MVSFSGSGLDETGKETVKSAGAPGRGARGEEGAGGEKFCVCGGREASFLAEEEGVAEARCAMVEF